jgi:hypothetical protein
MTASLSANQALARKKLDGQHLTATFCVAGWRRNSNATTLLNGTAMALSQARTEPSKQSLGL